ncbi:hypothetical protein RB620_11510 [Paenibacillus sp. LHD-117]|uniref:hypothetical protein n=1 Tax=Paenibacillus sp. LHD-117 TaxID=3071412 RepID=UPI0027DF024D|nr:hypothetical protein [Paenibacillus sp. LHD-117]MDQ6420063.1 hypothetical protein [Paenibacillus sp. LHD-117]
MEWYDRYKPQLTRVYGNAMEAIASFPPPLNETGLTYAAKFDPVDKDGGKDYICTLLPFWMQDSASLSDEQCGQLALANVYGMLYFFIQDDVMDSNVAGGDWKIQLALGNMLQLEMFRIFRGLFPSDSPFWRYYDGYARIWADSVVNEGRGNYFLTNPLLTAGKAGPVKISVVGALLLHDSQGELGKTLKVSESTLAERIAATEEAVDITLMTLQMLDDWADWEEDLADGSYNGLLAMIAAGIDSAVVSDSTARDFQPGYNSTALSKERIEAAIYVRGCMKPYAEIAVRYHGQLLANPFAPPDLVAFNLYMLESLHRIADQLEERKRKLLGGGINLLFAGLQQAH